ncbi:MAG TPA: serine/threonine-protein kinase [Polyangiaceae bacterium]|jgi:serine/threonine-protein kinase|nr:serine/threonine-protein kinase [Polyangiaceae bacterium]
MRCPECGNEFRERGFRFCPYDGSRLEAPQWHRGKEEVSETVETGALIGGRYVVRRYLTKGAMARIFMADDQHTGQLVALKILEKNRAKSSEVRERFLREAKAVSLIDNPCVVKILDMGEHDKRPFLVMEFLRGETLGERFDVEPRLDHKLALWILLQAADALYAAHDKGIVHRDVKPDNIFIVGDTKQPTGIRVLDFGLSRLFQSQLTATGTVIGTPGYMAPEQVVADPVDQRTDIYGLGMIMYRMYAGCVPFDGKDDVIILAKQLLRRPPRPSHYVDGLDPRVERVIMTTIRKRPEERYPSMKIFSDELHKLQHPNAPLFAPELPNDWDERARDRYELSSPLAKEVAKGYRKLLKEGEA